MWISCEFLVTLCHGQGRKMKTIITFITLSLVNTIYAAGEIPVESDYDLLSGSTYTLGSGYSISTGLPEKNSFGSTDYNLFSNSFTGADDPYDLWVGVEGKYGELSVGAQVPKVSDSSDSDSQTSGLALNAQSHSVEAALEYRRVLDEAKTVKGRLSYKSRNNSKVRLDLVAEKVEIESSSTSDLTDSTSLILGASYKVTPKAYVSGQYGVIGFENDADLSPEELDENQDYNAFSLEAGYSLTDKTSVYINHTQKSFDSGLQLPFAHDLEGGSQTNSIGVRLNW